MDFRAMLGLLTILGIVGLTYLFFGDTLDVGPPLGKIDLWIVLLITAVAATFGIVVSAFTNPE